MAKYCPLIKENVVYLDCQECDMRDKCNRGELEEADKNGDILFSTRDKK